MHSICLEHNRNGVAKFLLMLVSLALGARASNTPMGDYAVLTETEFKARCEAAKGLSSQDVTCESLWTSFTGSFQCPSTNCTPVTDASRYSEFIDIIPPKTAFNKTLFYSGTKAAAQNIGKNCVHKNTIESTFLGRIFDNGIWCCARDGDMDVACSEDRSCTDTVLKLFWTAASEVFASNAMGYPAAVLNGSAETPPYREDSIFTTAEVPSLTSYVRRMTIILAYDDGGESGRRWTCNSPDSRLGDLHADLAKKGISYNCTDDLWFSGEVCNPDNSAWTTVPLVWLILWLAALPWSL